MVYSELGDHTNSLARYEELLALSRPTLAPDHPDTLRVMKNLAQEQQNVGRLAEAIPLFEKILELRKAKLPPGHPDIARSEADLAHAYYDTNRFAEAETLLRTALPVMEEKLSGELCFFDAQAWMGRALAGQKNYPSAVEFMRKAYDNSAASFTKHPTSGLRTRMKSTASRLANYYHQWNKPDEAAIWEKRLAELRQSDPKTAAGTDE
jgi:tetratricopeptide (TPR) repeat protein